jgi:DNA-binding response OmpR family regulator
MNMIAHDGVLDAGVEFLQKPYDGTGLMARVGAILDQRDDVRRSSL